MSGKQSYTAESTADKKIPSYVHMMSGGIAGTVGAIITCPLELVKTRLQSSNYTAVVNNHPLSGTFSSMKRIYNREGFLALYRGVGPTLIGVVPSRATYFATYSQSKQFWGDQLMNGNTDSSLVHLLSAVCAGVAVSTLTNPIWMVKTRVQLEESSSLRRQSVTSWGIIRQIFREEGIRGFYRGLTASYMGISETALQFVVYEKFKTLIKLHLHETEGQGKAHEFMAAAGLAKLIASTSTYPHEVVRTRLRERHSESDMKKYNGLVKTFRSIVKYEGVLGLYNGLGAHLIRVVPNTAIMFTTYELTVTLWEKFVADTNANELLISLD
eukprot:Nk52_evm14s236 gene=Nk52_evmTU14s236